MVNRHLPPLTAIQKYPFILIKSKYVTTNLPAAIVFGRLWKMWNEMYVDWVPMSNTFRLYFVFERQHEIWSDPITVLNTYPWSFYAYWVSSFTIIPQNKTVFCTMYCTDGGWCQSCFPTIWYGDHYSHPINSQWVKSSLALHCFPISAILEILLCWHKPSPSKQGKYGNITRFSRLKEKCVLVLY